MNINSKMSKHMDMDTGLDSYSIILQDFQDSLKDHSWKFLEPLKITTIKIKLTMEIVLYVFICLNIIFISTHMI